MAVNREQVLQSAEKLLSRGKLDQALKEYLRVLEDNPKDIPTLNKVGDLYVRMNRPGESIPYFERIADFYSKDGFFLKAIAIYKKINKIDPARLEVYDRLADLYHKQGLVQDARSQYQVLADHYQKNNRIPDAIAVYKKMAAIDPSDLRIQVRLADLYRAANQKDQAVMQYGLIGSMLLKRGAHDEAAQVFQKALELSPDDVETQRNLVRSLLAQKNTAAAMAVLKAAPRGPARAWRSWPRRSSRWGSGRRRVRTAEQALALDADAETPRLFICPPARAGAFARSARSMRSPRSWTPRWPGESSRAQPSTSSRSSPRTRAMPAALEKTGAGPRGRGQSRRAREGPRRARTERPRRAARRAPSITIGARRRPIPRTSRPRRRIQQIGTPIGAPRRLPAGASAPAEPEYQELVLDLEDSASIHAPQPKVPSIDVEEPAPVPEAAPPPAAPPPAAAPPPRGLRPTTSRSRR